MKFLSPSIMTADFTNLSNDIDQIVKAGVTNLHLDVMDGNFVPNISFGPKIISDLKNKYSEMVFDAHLMVKNPENLIKNFADAGCDYITIHPESTIHIHRQLQLIKSLGKKSGISLNPSTPLDVLDYIIDDVDLILIMSVNPGFGGQNFIPSIKEKIKKTKELIKDKNIILQVDGGIKLDNIESILKAGATSVVVGSAIFDGKNIKNNAIEFLDIINE